MRVRTLEIRWHDSKPISTCDFQPAPFKKGRPTSNKGFTTQSYRLATGGEDNHVRLWMIYPNIMPASVLAESAVAGGVDVTNAFRPPRVEYLATLGRHSAAVNVVRFSPNGELIASSGDDGMIIVWASSATPNTSTYGSDISQEEAQYDKEYWKPRLTFRCTTMQVYDLAWSPTGEYILAGSTDNVARVFTACDGKCIKEIVEHSHYVQGVAWDPMNEYIATQSSDRSMHVHKIISKGPGQLEIHAIGKNTRIQHQHNHTPRRRRTRHFRRESTAASDAESSTSEITKDEFPLSQNQQPMTPSTPANPPSIPMPPPPVEASSRRSSFSNPPGSPAVHTRLARSPSPMPALPAIRAVSSSAPMWTTAKLYGDESFTNFFRRLTFSPDGGLLLTPAGQFEDPSVIPGLSDPTTKSKKRNNDTGSTSSVYIYTRANFARPPIAQLPGHKKASVGVRFSPILYELRQGVLGFDEPQSIVVEQGKEEAVRLDLGEHTLTPSFNPTSPHRHSIPTPSLSPIVAPTPVFPGAPSTLLTPSPALRATDAGRSPTPARSIAGTPTPSTVGTSSVFALPYRMFYAVATMDTVTIYDTQQAGPICLLTKLHYDEFTDITWSPDGQCLVVSSRDGYCTIVVFDEILAAHHTQQHTLQIQSIANHHSVPLTYSSSTPAPTPGSTPSIPVVGLPPLPPPLITSNQAGLKRRAESPPPLLTPASSVDNENLGIRSSVSTDNVPTPQQALTATTGEESEKERPKKKRRAALTKVADLG